MPASDPPSIRILGVRFYAGTEDALIADAGNLGFTVFPSAPVLVQMADDDAHRVAVESADWAIADSAWMVLLWRMLGRTPPPRISGLRFLRRVLATEGIRRSGAAFWVMPSPRENAANRAWLRTQGIEVGDSVCYDAPLYTSGPIADPALLARIEATRPPYIVLCLGGGVQERLGHYLRQQLTYRPAIFCIGAAIAFLSGQQVGIPSWADRLYLGWLFRTISAPRKYFPRYWRSLRLAGLIFRFRSDRLR